MEVIQILARDSQSIFQRVFIELVRRKVRVNDAFLHKNDKMVTMIMSISRFSTRGEVMQALRNLEDVLSAEWLEENVECHWEKNANGSSVRIIRDGVEINPDVC